MRSLQTDKNETPVHLRAPDVSGLLTRLQGGWNSGLAPEIERALSPSLAATDQVQLASAFLSAISRCSDMKGTQATCSALLQASRTFYGACDFGSGAICAEVGAKIAVELNLPRERCLLLKVLAAHLTELGQLAASIETNRTAIAVAEANGLRDQLAPLYNNLGTACMYAFAYPAALECLKRASEEAENFSPPHYNMAWIFLQRREVDLALAAITEGRHRANYTEPGRELIQAVALTIETSAFVAAERNEAATASAQQAQQIADFNPLFSRQAALAKGIAACAIDITEGTRLLEEFYWEVQKERGSLGMARLALSELVAAYERAERPEEALRYLHHMLELDKSAHRAQVVLAGQFGAAASTALYDLETRKAQLQQAIVQTMQNLEDLAVRAGLMADYDECHVFRRGRLCRLLGEALGYDASRCEELTLAGRYADIGLAAVPDRILRKEGLLNEGERHLVAEHTLFGAELIGSTRLQRLHPARRAALSHHERWDGTGRPSQLRGDAIPIEARIVALADALEALTHARPWRPAYPINAALLEIERGKGSSFDPDLTTIFAEAVRAAYWSTADWERFLSEDADSSPLVRMKQLMKRRTHSLQ